MLARRVLIRLREVTLSSQVPLWSRFLRSPVQVLLARPLCWVLGHEYSRTKHRAEHGWCDWCGKYRHGLSWGEIVALHAGGDGSRSESTIMLEYWRRGYNR